MNIEDLVARSRAAQNLPAKVEDPAALHAVAVLLNDGTPAAAGAPDASSDRGDSHEGGGRLE